MINTASMEKALNFLAESELQWSELRASKDIEHKRAEIVLASGIIDSPSSSQAGKKVDSMVSTEYKKAIEDYNLVLEAFYLIDAQRKRAEITIDVWRSINSSRNKGQIV